ncbi:DUF2274 domain-containing protein [Mesorhizobium sp.]|uniref:DUF2274 domain-containing protein n=1 Tax=Mesorhizobium sp. TaxID=1871066 RepID=UPI000FE6FAF9|nr:DUF2274 domain-containing protein [Mesorhizobium sp.]RWP33581.1 MAG: DUF2274 domain-containing protein [Mesorhizobium sp.]
MADLKLGKLPDRTASKITITVSAELGQTLKEYAALYRQTYRQSETVAELIPFMLAAFLEGDRAFAKEKKVCRRSLPKNRDSSARGSWNIA